jgi:hypothetical protein
MTSALSLKFFFITIPVVLFLHEMEEWNIVEFHRKNYKIQFNETNMSERLWLFILSLIGLFFSILCQNIDNEVIANSVFLVLTTFLTINGLQHLLLTVSIKKYNPGFVFGGVIGTSLSILYDIKLLQENIIPFWIFLAITLLEFVPATYDTIRSQVRGSLPNMIVQILRFANFVERKMRE